MNAERLPAGPFFTEWSQLLPNPCQVLTDSSVPLNMCEQSLSGLRGDTAMITFVDLGSTAHVHLFLLVPRPLPAGGWTWGEHPAYPGRLAKEFAYSARECRSLVQTYGRTMTRIMSGGQLGDRFRVYARGRSTGMVLGIREWEWSPISRDYVPVGEYMCGWREAIKAYYVRTGEIFSDKRFSALSTPLRGLPELVQLPPCPLVIRTAA